MIIAYRSRNRAVFLYAFAKSEQENIGSDELIQLRKLGLNWLNSPPQKIAEAIANRSLQEVDRDEQSGA